MKNKSGNNISIKEINPFGFRLSSFSINNFRVFDSNNNFDLSPLTILTGTNNSGKSSFFKALMLLQKSYQKNGLRKLDLMETSLKLGNFDNIKNFHSVSDLITFELVILKGSRVFLQGLGNIKIRLTFNKEGIESFSIFDLNDNCLVSVNLFFNYLKSYTITKSFITLNSNVIDDAKVRDSFYYLDDFDCDKLIESLHNYLQSNIEVHKYQAIYYEEINPNSDIIKEVIDGIIFSLRYIGFKEDRTNNLEEGEVNVSSFLSANPIIKDVISESLNNKIDLEDMQLEISKLININHLVDSLKSFSDIDAYLRDVLNSIDFIGSNRGSQEIVFTRENTPKQTFEAFEKYVNSDYPPLMDLSRWLTDSLGILKAKDALSAIEMFQIQEIAGFGYKLRFKIDGKETDISSLGNGVMQLFPILLKLALNNSSILYIEEPESNLHPALQSKLADVLVDAMNMYKGCLIVETHSEYLIRRLQVLTANTYTATNKNDTWKKLKTEDTQIYYFYQADAVPEGEKQVYKINIEEDGALTKNFGKGFFDESSNLNIALYNFTTANKN